MNSWSKEEENQISTSLSKKLGPEYISYRQGYNNKKLSYVEGWLIMELANKIFGFNGWSSEIKNITVDYSDFHESKGAWCIGISVTIRVSLKDGTYKEDIGFGSAEGVRRKSDGYEKAKKEAVTDAIKRALRQFGNALGNCCYDKEYLTEIIKVTKEKPAKMDVQNLLRKIDIPDNRWNASIDIDDFMDSIEENRHNTKKK